MKQILLAIPTARYIESETFKSIYDLTVPAGFNVTFQCFYGYNIDQVRNLIASEHWGSNRFFDYVLCVDSDIQLPKDALVKMLSHDVDVVSGIYIQRIPGQQNIEVFKHLPNGTMPRMTLEEVMPAGLHEVGGVGFGCVLVKSEVFRKIGYPQFVYKSAIDHKNTVSEDVDFCAKARKVGAKIYVDSSIVCKHHGSWVFEPVMPAPMTTTTTQVDTSERTQKLREYLRNVSTMDLIPETFKRYMTSMHTKMSITPKVIYDIGANCLHWTQVAQAEWPDAKIIAFDATSSLKFLYEEANIEHHIDVLGNIDGKSVIFYENDSSPSGNSYYKENIKFSKAAAVLYTKEHEVLRTMRTLDSVVAERRFPYPDLIKMDVQGAEADILMGAEEVLKHCNDLILELQHEEYNIGSPHVRQVISYLESIGFRLISKPNDIDRNEVAGDYHFQRKAATP